VFHKYEDWQNTAYIEEPGRMPDAWITGTCG
jgi:hypothetical protein